eukprot:jgi/Phyca11/9606/fgenesh1_pm.PHYCAscaffold_39_\
MSTIAFRELYRYGVVANALLLSVGVVMAGIGGVLFPCMALVFSDAVGAFARADGGVDVDAGDSLTLPSRLTGDTVKIKDRMSQKLGESVKYTCQFITGYVIGFIRGWDMSLVIMPFMVASLGVLMTSLRKRAVHSQQMYADPLAFSSAVFGLFMCSIWLMYAVGLWFGGSKVATTRVLHQNTTNITVVAEAKEAAAQIYKILDTPSSNDERTKPETCVGRIQAVGVNFTYPSRPDPSFVGASGIGKSTLISLLERFYDPQQGSILLDGRDVKTLNETVLFATSIFENIATGGRAVRYSGGEKGVSLSGGQKQRESISRAIPPAQAALNHLMDKTRMTTLVIAHRLSTIRKADKIVVVNGGHVVEEGNHDELLAIEDGICKKLNFAVKYMAEKLTSRLRDVHFTALCRQNIGIFDEKKNATGALTADLSTNAT